MNSMNERRVLVEQMATKMNKNIFEGVADKLTEPRLQLQKQSEKLTSLEEAIKRCGLKDGMTISFHHHFRGGDKVVNLVVGKLAEMGFKNLHVAASSLQDVHEPLLFRQRLSIYANLVQHRVSTVTQYGRNTVYGDLPILYHLFCLSS